MLVASRGHLEACQFLVNAGSDPADTDIAGMDAAGWARRAGHLKIAEYLDSLGLASKPSNIEPVSNFGSSPSQALDDMCAWDEDVEPTAPDHDARAVAQVDALQRTISLHHGEFDDEEWRDVSISLPSITFERIASSNLSDEVRNYLVKCLVEGNRAGLIDISEIERFMPPSEGRATQEILVHFARVASDVGIQVVDVGSPYCNDLGPESGPEGTPQELVDALDVLLEVDHLLDGRHDPMVIVERDIAQMRRLDRFEEVTLFRTIRKAADEEALAIAQSSPALALLQTYGRRVETGELPLAMISDLEQPDDVSEIDHPDEEEDAADQAGNERANELGESGGIADVPNSALSSPPLLPPTFAAGMRQILSADPSRTSSSADTRALARAIKDLALSDAFFKLFLSDLTREGDGACASLIASCRTAVRKARDRVIMAHLPHVLRLAKRFRGRGMPTIDLFQEGSIGLFRAIELFDPERGFRFQAYAMHWVRQQVSRAIADKARLIRIPVHRFEALAKIQRFQLEFLCLTNRNPTTEEISDRLEFPTRRISSLLAIADPPETIDEYVDDDDRFIDCIPAANASALEREIQADLKRKVTAVLTTLSAREERVLRMRFGIGMRTDHTLEEVGKQFGVTRERIRQIEAKGIRKLRHRSRSRTLRSFLDQ